jgi:plastocyanin
MRALLALTALLALGAAPPPPAGVTVSVRAPNGAPVRDAVVTVRLVGRATPLPSAGDYTVDQKNIQFHPFVLVVPVNSNVAFPNLDPIRHHVYSFSPAKRFELKLYAREQNRSVRFDKAGIVALGCNIHDQMTAFIDVVDTPWAAKTDASGNVVLNGIPAGQVAITVWHPYLRAPGNVVTKQVAVGNAGARESFSVTLRSPPRMTGSPQY